MTCEEDDLPEFYVPEEELHPLLEAIGNAVVERLRGRGLTGVVVYYDDLEGQTHVTAYLEKYPKTFEEDDAIWEGLVEVSRRFFDETVIILHADEEDGSAYVSSDRLVALEAA
jgi:hypothetical protein